MIFFSGLVRLFSAELASTFGFGLCSGTTLTGLWVGNLISWETGASSTLGVGAIGWWFGCERSVREEEKININILKIHGKIQGRKQNQISMRGY